MVANTHKHSPWRKTFLVPFWIAQLLLSLLMIALFALALGVLATYTNSVVDENGDIVVNGKTVNYNDYKPAVEGVAALWLALNGVCFILIIIEIILLFRRSLKPLTFVIMNTIKSGIWTTIFVFDVIALVQDNGTYSRTRSAVGLVIEIILLLCFLAPLIYGSVIYHRSRKDGGSYKPVDHPYQNPVADFGAPTAYPSQYKAFVQESDVESNRVPGARRLSYNHQKDPRFESYRRASNSYGDSSILETTMISTSPDVPNIHVQHHDGEAFEMAGRRGLR